MKPNFTIREVNAPCVMTRYSIFNGRRKAQLDWREVEKVLGPDSFLYNRMDSLFLYRPAAEMVAKVLNEKVSHFFA